MHPVISAEETVLCQLYIIISYSYRAHSFLLKGEQPFCLPCNRLLSLECILLHCSDWIRGQQNYFQAIPLCLLFRDIPLDSFFFFFFFLFLCSFSFFFPFFLGGWVGYGWLTFDKVYCSSWHLYFVGLLGFFGVFLFFYFVKKSLMLIQIDSPYVTTRLTG